MTDISIVTFTTGGRDKYLNDAIMSVVEDIINCSQKITIDHHVVLQGCEVPQILFDVRATISSASEDYDLHIHKWPENIGLGLGLNKINDSLQSNFVLKLDDDAKIVSKNFFETALFMHKKFPEAIFSGFPIGLVNNPGGSPAISREIVHNEDSDIYHMIKNVGVVGGFARFSPKLTYVFKTGLIKGISGSETAELAQWAQRTGIKMFYVETGMAVEHNEGLCQQSRNPEYFTNRPGDLATFKKWIG